MQYRSLVQRGFIAAGIAVCSIFLATVLQAGQTPATVKYTSKEGGFSAKMAEEPKLADQELKQTPLGPTTLHTFTVERNKGSYFFMVGYSDYQTRLDSALSLEGVIDGQVKALKGKITSDKRTTLKGYPGRSVTIEAEGTVFFSTIYIAGNRLYQVMCGIPKGDTMPADAREFLDSFEILV